jgi:predicted DNA-binding transcriptional regulator AlpA
MRAEPSPLDNNDPALAALMRDVPTAAHLLVELLQAAFSSTIFPNRWEQHLRNILGTTNPADLTPDELAEFKDRVFRAAEGQGMRNLDAWLVCREQLNAKAAAAAAAKLQSAVESGDSGVQQRSAEGKPVTVGNSAGTNSAASPPQPVAPTVPSETTKAELPSRAEAAVEAGGIARDTRDEVVIDSRRFVHQRRAAAILGRSQRTLQRWRKEGIGPPSTKIGRTVYYEISKLLEWLETQRSA